MRFAALMTAFFCLLLCPAHALPAFSGLNLTLPSSHSGSSLIIPGNFGGAGPLVLAAPFQYLTTQAAVRDVPARAYLSSARMSSASHDDMVAYGEEGSFDAAYGFIDIYQLGANSISLIGAKHNLSESGGNLTYIYFAASPGMGKIMYGGKRNWDFSYGFLSSITFSGGQFGQPSNLSISAVPAPNGNTFEEIVYWLDSGDVDGDGKADTCAAIWQDSYGAMADWLHVTLASGSQAAYKVPGTYSSPMAKIGNFAPQPGNEIAYVGGNSSSLKLYLLKMEAGAITQISSAPLRTSTGLKFHPTEAAAADLDSDGYDELLLTGAYYPTQDEMAFSDAMQVYKFTAQGGWAMKNEKLGMSGSETSLGSAIAADDVEGDGAKEILVAASAYDPIVEEYGGSLVVSVLRYNSTGATPKTLGQTRFKAANATDATRFEFFSASFGDYNEDGKKELSSVYYDFGRSTDRLAAYKVGRDIYPPSVQINSSTSGSFYSNGTYSLLVSASDAVKLNESSGTARLFGNGYDSGSKALPKQAMVRFGKTPQYVASFSLAGLAPGEYTILVKMSDAAGNSANATAQLRVAAPPSPSQPPAANESQPPAADNSMPPAPAANESSQPPAANNSTPPAPDNSQPPATDNGVPAAPATNESAQPATDNGVPPAPAANESAQPGTSQPSSGQPTQQSAAEQARLKVAELEVKVNVAKSQGISVAPAEGKLARAQAYEEFGKYPDAQAEAQAGIALVDAAISGAPQPQSAAQQLAAESKSSDYTPYLILAGALVLAAAIYSAFGRKGAAPQQAGKK